MEPLTCKRTEWEDAESSVVKPDVEIIMPSVNYLAGSSSRWACLWWNRQAAAYQSDEELWRWTGPWDL